MMNLIPLMSCDVIISVDLDWSIGNDFIISASHDGTYRLWDSSDGRCLREIEGQSNVQATCCRFHPHNGNLLIVSITS